MSVAVRLGVRDMAPRKDKFAVGNSTPITIGLALALLTAIVGFGFKAGAITREMENIASRVNSIETREITSAKNNIDLVTKLTRIETLLESANATISRLEREQQRR